MRRSIGMAAWRPRCRCLVTRSRWSRWVRDRRVRVGAGCMTASSVARPKPPAAAARSATWPCRPRTRGDSGTPVPASTCGTRDAAGQAPPVGLVVKPGQVRHRHPDTWLVVVHLDPHRSALVWPARYGHAPRADITRRWSARGDLRTPADTAIRPSWVLGLSTPQDGVQISPAPAATASPTSTATAGKWTEGRRRVTRLRRCWTTDGDPRPALTMSRPPRPQLRPPLSRRMPCWPTGPGATGG